MKAKEVRMNLKLKRNLPILLLLVLVIAVCTLFLGRQGVIAYSFQISTPAAVLALY
jgi:hypothetical protein